MGNLLTMHSAAVAEDIEEFEIVGLALSHEASRRVAAAFGGSVQYVSTIEKVEDMSASVSNGRSVVFYSMPAMPAAFSLRDTVRVKLSSAKVIGLHPSSDKAVYDGAFEAGFDGVLDCNASPETYRRASSGVLCGELWFPRGYLSHKTRELRMGRLPGGLSVREAEIFQLAAAGHSNQSIADTLYISRDTVRWHLRSIHTKLGTSSRAHLLQWTQKATVNQR